MAFPPELSALLGARTQEARESAWSSLVAEHSRLILHVARTLGSDPDGAMDRYAAVLEQLRRDDYRRLRTFADDGRSRFTTWLVVVARRICLDHERHKHGRLRDAEHESAARARLQARRRLADLVSAEAEMDGLTDPDVVDALEGLCDAELMGALHVVVDGLPPSDRLLLSLRFEDDRSAVEIARILSLPSPFHVYRRLNTVVSQLRRALAERGIGSPSR
jgi:RNA polymerase sigma factor (sigma-70 family)